MRFPWTRFAIGHGELAELVDAAAQTDTATDPLERIPYSEEKMLLPELAELYQQNGDLVGWISIADTNINYPVMQSVNSLRLDDYLCFICSAYCLSARSGTRTLRLMICSLGQKK